MSLFELLSQIHQTGKFTRLADDRTSSFEADRNGGGKLCLVPQNLYELWVVATRPTNANGFGLDASAATSMIDDALTKFQLMRDERGIFDNWLNLIQVHQILGKTAHDARLVAAMQRHSISNILTFNKGDFSRFPICVFSPADIISGVIPKS